MNTDILGRFGPLFFAAGGTIIVLWQMLLPGYVLTWDMVFGPSRVFPELSGFLNGLPLTFLIYGAGLLVPTWIVQKVILVGLFFSLFYLPVRFFPFRVDIWTRFVAATFFAVNPFVYERFLAGQWAVLAGYALLAPFIYFLLELLRKPSVRTSLYLAFTMLLVGIFSLHTFVMAAFVATIVVAFSIVRLVFAPDLQKVLDLTKYALLAGTLVAVVSLYWTLPYFLNPESSPLPVFTEAHWQAFETSADPQIGAAGNVAMLYGFWGESYPWMQTLLSPKDVPPVFLLSLVALLALIVLGAFVLLRAREARPYGLVLIGIGILAFIFSLGTSPSFFQNFNTWLFENVSFWSGFRDSQKWSMWLAVSYAYFFAAGGAYAVFFLRPHFKRVARLVLVLLPLVYTFTMPLGFAGQLSAVDYPASWYEVNAILAKDPDCTALFLPWHQYYGLSFNYGMLTVNPASSFFDCTIVSAQDAEIGEVGDQRNSEPAYRAIAQIVTGNDTANIDTTISVLRSEGIRYIIFTDDVLEYDYFTYPFLTHPELERLYEHTIDNLHVVVMRL